MKNDQDQGRENAIVVARFSPVYFNVYTDRWEGQLLKRGTRWNMSRCAGRWSTI